MKTKEKIKCTLCFRLFPSQRELKSHYKNTHDINKLKPI